jgi:hypothetical protein
MSIIETPRVLVEHDGTQAAAFVSSCKEYAQLARKLACYQGLEPQAQQAARM